MAYEDCIGLNWRTVPAKILYVAEWIMNECDGEHQNIDPRTLDKQARAEMGAEALAAWDGGAGESYAVVD